MKTLITASLIMALTTACGDIPTTETEGTTTSSNYDDDAEYDDETPVDIRGYISPAFDVIVDGKQYGDSEDFYSEKLAALKAEAKNAGYEGWTMTLSAAIGLDDLSDGMTVFIAATGNRGYASETYLDTDGRFTFHIPVADQKYKYNIRANKRIGLKLTPPVDKVTGYQAESISWCYNFSAELHDVVTDGESMILNSFSTKITQYKCQSNSENGGIHIP